ncbi:MAG: 50S ribosome-binding GTPase [Immundisolibacterales bacterium]|nr:50S ribosome-binding GTPase [Immundisolibacterales bacterium]
MPANLSPDYKAAEVAFRRASDPKERLERLREMLRTIPKHKGTEHLQADIKTRIKQLTEELAAGRKGGSRSGPSHVVRPEGAAQIALLGPPNSGKSTLHDRLTRSHAEAGPYPFTTQFPQPGMIPYEDVNLQLVDLPPITDQYTVPWIVNALQPADAALLVVDVGAPDCMDQLGGLLSALASRKITFVPEWKRAHRTASEAPRDTEEISDPFAIRLPAALVAARADENPDADDELEILQELLEIGFPSLAVSARTGDGLDALAKWLFEALEVVRVYTKAPGRPPDFGQPFTVRRGDTVQDVARMVHQEIADSLKFGRLWRNAASSGRQVGRDYRVADRDVLELVTGRE